MSDTVSPGPVTISGEWSVTIPADRVVECPALATATTADLSQPIIAAIVPALATVLDGLEITEAEMVATSTVHGGVSIARAPEAAES